MAFKDRPIKRKLTTLFLLTSGVAVLLTCAAYLTADFMTFRKTTVEQLSTLGEVVAANSTAAIAFGNQRDADKVLASLGAQRHIVAAALYDRDGLLFSRYPAGLSTNDLPPAPELEGYRVDRSSISGFQPIAEGRRRLGTIYLKSDTNALYARLRLDGLIMAGVVVTSLLVAFIVSAVLQRQISAPILTLAETAHAIADRGDYSVRATKSANDEVGVLTDAFNHMLTRIDDQDRALRESDQRLNLALMSSGVGTWSWNIVDQSLVWDDYLHPLYGLAPKTFSGRVEDARRLIHPDDRLRVDQCIAESVRSNAPYDTEHRVIWPDGTVRVLATRGRVYRDATGGPARLTGVTWDVTERDRAEQESRDRATVAALEADIGLSLTAGSLSEALQGCCEAFVTHLGVASARIWALNDNDIDGALELKASAGVHAESGRAPASVPVGQGTIGRIARDRLPYLTNTAGEEAGDDWVREGLTAFAGHPLVAGQRVLGVMALFAQRTLSEIVATKLEAIAFHLALGIERYRSAEALRIAEERMRFTLKNADVGIWDLHYATGALRWSETIEAHYGFMPGTFSGTFDAFIERVHPDDTRTVLASIDGAAKSGADFFFENRSIWPDGTVRWLSSRGRVHLGDNGEPVRAVGISLDITDRRMLEGQFQQAQKMEAVGRLAGGVAHDFNNLLGVILGSCELLLLDMEPGSPYRPDVSEIRRAGERAAGLTRQLLAFSRKQIIEPTLLDLNAIVTDVRPMLARLIGEDVKVVLALQPKAALIHADRGQIEQVILNLVVNARDAMPHGGTLTVQTTRVELDEHYAQTHVGATPGSYVALVVSDTGTGMTPEVQARLFEPFFTTKDVGKGTGLGLATVHGIVAGCRGSVGVYSELGRGTAFNVFFPIAQHLEPLAEEARLVPECHGDTHATVLVVEDADGLRNVTQRLLQQLGYTVIAAANAEEAMGLCADNVDIDVVLTDVVMPGTSGPELIKQLVERRPGLKAIYMSGYTEEAIVHHGVIRSGIAFLHKPLASAALGKKVHEVLSGIA